MPDVTEGSLTFSFGASWEVSKYDEWPFYRNQLTNAFDGCKGVDFVALDGANRIVWLIEVKDYRQHGRTKGTHLWNEIACKVRDTMAGLVALTMQQPHVYAEQDAGKRALQAQQMRVVLHLEQPLTGTKLRPRPFDLASVRQKLRSLLKAVDPHVVVTDEKRKGTVPWTVTDAMP